jgi:hypothetical protein
LIFCNNDSSTGRVSTIDNLCHCPYDCNPPFSLLLTTVLSQYVSVLIQC